MLGRRAASEVSESCLHTRERTFVLHTSLFMSLKREKLGSWEGDLVSICISRHVVYTRASAGGFLIFIFKTSFPSSFRLTERLGKSNCNIENSPEKLTWS